MSVLSIKIVRNNHFNIFIIGVLLEFAFFPFVLICVLIFSCKAYCAHAIHSNVGIVSGAFMTALHL